MLQAALAAWSIALCAQALPIAPPPAASQTPDLSVARLKSLVEAAEKAMKEEDWDLAGEKAEAADDLVDTLLEVVLKQPDVQGLVTRLRAVQKELESDDEEAAALKMSEEVVTLSGDELRTELERVRSAETGESFDFPIDLNDKVATWVHLFSTSRKGFMEGALSRGTAYMPMIRQVFAEEGVPQDLAYLAVIESGFKNVARSRAAAVGMWQFIRDTGRIYGLQNTAWVDERRDPVEATRAAARYLKRLYDTRGDWYLALAGYNCGPGKVDRAADALGTRNYWDLCRSRYIPPDTRHYVPQILAAMLIGKNPEKYGLKVPQAAPYAFETVEVDRQTSLQVIARYASTDLGSLRDLNPELLRGSTPPGTFKLKVPPGAGTTVARALHRIPASQRLAFTTYKVRKGDTLAKVAAKFKVAPEDLLETNGLTKAQFKPGRKIQVPPPPAAPVNARDLRPREEQARLTPNRPLDPIPAIPTVHPVEPEPMQVEAPKAEVQAVKAPDPKVRVKAEPKAKPTPVKARFHTVKRGETLFSIATRYDVEVHDLQKWNKVKGNKIQAGQSLRVTKP